MFRSSGKRLEVEKLVVNQKWSHLAELLPIFDVVGVSQ